MDPALEPPIEDSDDELVEKQALDARRLTTRKGTVDRRVYCLSCSSEQVMECYNLCPACNAQDSTCGLDHILAVRSRDCTVLSNFTRVIPYDLMLAIGGYIVENTQRR